MSLTTLTFSGNSGELANSIGKGKIKVLKADKFYGSEGLCVIGKLVEGAISKKMKVAGKENCSVESVESKYGDGSCCHTGAQVVLMVNGLSKEELEAVEELAFEVRPSSAMESAKPKGKIIIA